MNYESAVGVRPLAFRLPPLTLPDPYIRTEPHKHWGFLRTDPYHDTYKNPRDPYQSSFGANEHLPNLHRQTPRTTAEANATVEACSGGRGLGRRDQFARSVCPDRAALILRFQSSTPPAETRWTGAMICRQTQSRVRATVEIFFGLWLDQLGLTRIRLDRTRFLFLRGEGRSSEVRAGRFFRSRHGWGGLAAKCREAAIYGRARLCGALTRARPRGRH
jgi:hypothetical protein